MCHRVRDELCNEHTILGTITGSLDASDRDNNIHFSSENPQMLPTFFTHVAPRSLLLSSVSCILLVLLSIGPCPAWRSDPPFNGQSICKRSSCTHHLITYIVYHSAAHKQEVASFPGSRAQKHEHWSCAGVFTFQESLGTRLNKRICATISC